MAERLKIGELIDRTLTKREQARLLSRMRDALRAEEVAQKAKFAARRRRHQQAPAALKAAKAKDARNRRLLAVMHTATDPEQIAAARRELLHQPLRDDPTPNGSQQAKDTRAAAVVQHLAPTRLSIWAKLGGPAPSCGPGDTTTAMVFYRKVTRLLEAGGHTASERAALTDLAAKWGPRALGTDARFNIVGTMVGRLPRALEQKINELKKRGQE